MEKLLKVSSSPHIRAAHTVQSIMLDVTIALLPALLVGVYFFGIRALALVVVSVIACVAFEAIWQKMIKVPSTIKDLSAVVTGILIAFNLPVEVPFYIPVVGAFIGIILAKQCFGGVGQNFINPALAARAFLLAAYPTAMTSFKTNVDTLTGATPLALLKRAAMESASLAGATPSSTEAVKLPSLMDAFVGNVGGCIGEVSAIALLIGGAYLLYKKIITWHIPTFYIGTVFVMGMLLGGYNPSESLYAIMLGGVMLGGFFMATDYTTTPMTVKGQIIFAIGAGCITTIIRLFGGYPEGVSYSILLMNLGVPLIDRYVKTKRFGEVKKS